MGERPLANCEFSWKRAFCVILGNDLHGQRPGEFSSCGNISLSTVVLPMWQYKKTGLEINFREMGLSWEGAVIV
jgi:hypothetical protein